MATTPTPTVQIKTSRSHDQVLVFFSFMHRHKSVSCDFSVMITDSFQHLVLDGIHLLPYNCLEIEAPFIGDYLSLQLPWSSHDPHRASNPSHPLHRPSYWIRANGNVKMTITMSDRTNPNAWHHPRRWYDVIYVTGMTSSTSSSWHQNVNVMTSSTSPAWCHPRHWHDVIHVMVITSSKLPIRRESGNWYNAIHVIDMTSLTSPACNHNFIGMMSSTSLV